MKKLYTKNGGFLLIPERTKYLEFENISCVYCLENKETGVKYIGSTAKLLKRLAQHEKKCNFNTILTSLEEEYIITVLHESKNRFERLIAESFWILYTDNVYNLNTAISVKGYKRKLILLSVEQREELIAIFSTINVMDLLQPYGKGFRIELPRPTKQKTKGICNLKYMIR